MILWPACNWKFIKYLQEAFKASELIFTGNRAGVCVANGGVSTGLCVPRTKNSSWEILPLPKVSLAGKTFSSPCTPQWRRITMLDLPRFRDEVFVLDPRSRFRQIGI